MSGGVHISTAVKKKILTWETPTLPVHQGRWSPGFPIQHRSRSVEERERERVI